MQVDEILSRDPEIMSGAVVFKGTRVPVLAVFENFAAGMSMDDVVCNFPTVERDQIKRVLFIAMQELEAQFVEDER
ncbi:DUF433 domain-containing protein [Aquibium sp. ELW1220]|uniref:DUF433 domain-containing protein n=1 Tax=Aquibium sp. ELW1220 TaxID=2976766 RepID=UPI0025AF8147|nr:DUF433 domain-containing protein [Aquibium sp. ELW1220]MDN2579508.1 DUF433 domain-containing protein [Aquibium sp. ELW1220]